MIIAVVRTLSEFNHHSNKELSDHASNVSTSLSQLLFEDPKERFANYDACRKI